MSLLLDHSLTTATETTYGVPVTPTRAYEWLDSSKLEQDPGTIQGAGLRQGSKFDRADRSTPGISRVSGSLNFELLSKGFGLLLGYAFGTSSSANVAGALYQQLFTATSSTPLLPSFVAQEGIVRPDGTIEAFTSAGCVVKSWTLAQPVGGPLTLKVDIDGRRKHRYHQVTGGTTSGSATITGTAGTYSWNDVGQPITGTGVPASTTITAVAVDGTSATMSANATATAASVTLSLGTAYVTPTYSSGATMFTSLAPASGAITFAASGALVAPTSTALASVTGGTVSTAVRSWELTVDNGLDVKREQIGNRLQPTTGKRKATISAVVEYDATTGVALTDYQASGRKLSWLLTSQTQEAITAGNFATLQLGFDSVRIDSGAFPAPTNGVSTTTTIKASVLDGLVAAQALYGVLRTADTAL